MTTSSNTRHRKSPPLSIEIRAIGMVGLGLAGMVSPAFAQRSDKAPAVMVSRNTTATPVLAPDPAPLPTPNAGSEIQVDIDPSISPPAHRPRDGFARLLSEEATLALYNGDIPRAAALYERLVAIDPADTAAWRELGRTLAAVGQTERAAEILAMVDSRQEHAPDPELHFIRGEALLALSRRAEALTELARAEAELMAHAPDRLGSLWLARIHALRGDYLEAARVYESLLPRNPAERRVELESVMLPLAEAYLIAQQWQLAEDTLQRFLAVEPANKRARELLAWSFEGGRRLGDELRLRTRLASEMSDSPERYTLALARVLERSFQFDAALRQYERAGRLGGEVQADIERMHGMLAPEFMGTLAAMTDPQGDRVGAIAGASVPLHPGIRAVLVAGHERAMTTDDPIGGTDETRLSFGKAWLVAGPRRGLEVAAGITAWQRDRDDLVERTTPEIAGEIVLRTSPARAARLLVRGETNVPWRESSTTVREGGSSSQAEGQYYYSLRPWLVFMAGGRARSVRLPASEMQPTLHADQLQGFTGLDAVVARGNDNRPRGLMFDNELLDFTRIASAVVVSFRHYEMSSDTPFGTRLSLVPRSSFDEISSTAWRVIDSAGTVSVQGQAGLGFDNIRSLWRWRAGGMLYLAFTPRAHASASFESTNETSTGITGRQFAAQMGLHVDL